MPASISTGASEPATGLPVILTTAMTLRSALLEAAMQVSRRDAETLLAHILRRDRAWLLAHAEDDLSPEHYAALATLIARRARGEPLQHLTGTQEFFGLTFKVSRDVLIPRPETEHLVEAVLDWAHRQSDAQPDSGSHLRIADVGTGSGAIAVALASVLEGASVTAIDISPAALAIARFNAVQHGVDRRVRFIEGDLLSPFADQPESLDTVASNPPYVALADRDTLAPEVRDHEPDLALYAGPDGLAMYRRLIPQAHAALRTGGLLALEIGYGQREPLAQLLSGWQQVRFIDDYAGIARVALAIRP